MAAVRFDVNKLRLEHVNVEVRYHAAYTFYGLKGAIAERWAHGPIFGAVGESGSGQLNLTPPTSGEEGLVGVLGIRQSALHAEGPIWAPQGPKLAQAFFEDIYTALKPKRTVMVRVEVLGLYPVRDPHRASARLRAKYYQDEALVALVRDEQTHAAVEAFVDEEEGHRTIVVGVIGPSHQGQYYNAPNEERDKQWFMGARIIHGVLKEDGIEEPLDAIRDTVRSATEEWSRISRSAFPSIVG